MEYDIKKETIDLFDDDFEMPEPAVNNSVTDQASKNVNSPKTNLSTASTTVASSSTTTEEESRGEKRRRRSQVDNLVPTTPSPDNTTGNTEEEAEKENKDTTDKLKRPRRRTVSARKSTGRIDAEKQGYECKIDKTKMHLYYQQPNCYKSQQEGVCCLPSDVSDDNNKAAIKRQKHDEAEEKKRKRTQSSTIKKAGVKARTPLKERVK